MKQYFVRSFILVSFLFISQLLFAQFAIVKGKVVDNSSNTSLPGAFVSLKNTSFKTTTGNDGSFELKNIPSGTFNMIVEFVGYTSIIHKVEVKAGSTVELSLGLKNESQELERVTVFSKLSKESEASSRISEKNANNITNVISARAMEQSPDVNAANVLQRISGITLQKNSGSDEAYSIIRGMEPRYNNTLINGVKITSPNEKSRFVSLNIVPSDLLQRIEVSKSLLPEMEGDAIGGTVNLIMKDAPDLMIFKAIGSLGYGNIFFDRKYDYFSKSDIQQKSVSEKMGSSYATQPGDFSRSNLDFKQKAALPTGIFGLTYGKRFFKKQTWLSDL